MVGRPKIGDPKGKVVVIYGLFKKDSAMMGL